MHSKVIILNDTRRDVGHIGCNTVMENIFYLCSINCLNVIKSFKSLECHATEEFLSFLALCDAVIINGEGTMHHDSPGANNLIIAAKIAKKAGKKIFLINSVWQSNSEINKELSVFDRIYVRESLSRQEISDAGYQATVCSDLSLYSVSPIKQRNYTNLDYVFIDSVIKKKTRFIALTALRYRHDFYYMITRKRKPLSNGFLRLMFFISGQKLKILRDEDISWKMITGRFHAMCFALKYGLPFIVMTSNTHKIEGLLQDIGLNSNDYIFSIESSKIEIDKKIKNLDFWPNDTAQKIKIYIDDAQVQISQMFQNIAQDIALDK